MRPERPYFSRLSRRTLVGGLLAGAASACSPDQPQWTGDGQGGPPGPGPSQWGPGPAAPPTPEPSPPPPSYGQPPVPGDDAQGLPVYSPDSLRQFAEAMRTGANPSAPSLQVQPLSHDVLGEVVRPEDFPGEADETAQVAKAIAAGAATGRTVLLSRMYVITRPLSARPAQPFRMIGTGVGRSGFAIRRDDPHDSLVLEPAGDPLPIVLAHFSIVRDNPSVFTGGRLIHVKRPAPVILYGIEAAGSEGMAILCEYAAGGVIARCHVHDNFGGEPHRSGTDGIHIYQGCHDLLVCDNTVERVGDDAISFGSYKAEAPNANNVCVRNRISHVAGSIKAYGNVTGLTIAYNSVSFGLNGGVTLWDDRDQGQSYDMTDVVIADNTLTDCGGPSASGGVYLTMTKGNGTGTMRRITIRDNTITHCKIGVSAFSHVPGKHFSNLRIYNNAIVNPTSGVGVMVDGMNGPLSVAHNLIQGAATPLSLKTAGIAADVSANRVQ